MCRSYHSDFRGIAVSLHAKKIHSDGKYATEVSDNSYGKIMIAIFTRTRAEVA